MLSHKLLSLLVSLLLVLSPFVPADVAAAAAGSEHCVMTGMDTNDSVSGAPHMNASASQAMPACQHCAGDSCNDNTCADHGCSSSHIFSLTTSGRMPLRQIIVTRYLAGVTINLQSHSSAPLLRPPV